MDEFPKSRQNFPHETKAVSDQVALWFFQKLIPITLIAVILQWLRNGITFLKPWKIFPWYQFKNKLRYRKDSIIKFTFRGTGVYQNPYWCEQDNRGSRQCKRSNIKLSLINPFHATDLFWYPLIPPIRGYQKRSVAWNGLSSPETILRT